METNGTIQREHSARCNTHGHHLAGSSRREVGFPNGSFPGVGVRRVSRESSGSKSSLMVSVNGFKAIQKVRYRVQENICAGGDDNLKQAPSYFALFDFPCLVSWFHALDLKPHSSPERYCFSGFLGS